MQLSLQLALSMAVNILLLAEAFFFLEDNATAPPYCFHPAPANKTLGKY